MKRNQKNEDAIKKFNEDLYQENFQKGKSRVSNDSLNLSERNCPRSPVISNLVKNKRHSILNTINPIINQLRKTTIENNNLIVFL